MLEDSPSHGEAAPEDRAAARRVALGFFALTALTFGLIVLGALVRAHEAGLACPDWPLCFGEVIPAFDLKVGFEWTHRAIAGTVSLCFVALGVAVLRRPGLRARAARLWGLAALLLAVQVLLGALTVWQLLASWTVTSHLIVGNSFNACLLWLGFSLRDTAQGREPEGAARPVRFWVAATALLLLSQMILGGLVSSTFAGMACPEYPACSGGAWFPSWKGSVGLHLVHRWNALLLVAALVGAAHAARGGGRLAAACALAAGVGVLQVGVGIANVLYGLPVEVTGLHSALAAALVLLLACALRDAFSAPPARAT